MRKNSGYKRGQHLVEFALILPIIVIILLIIIEYGYAIVARNTLSEAVKMTVSRLNRIADMPGDNTTKVSRIENEITIAVQDYFKKHDMLYDGTVNVTVTQQSGSETALVLATYRYFPAFTLPRVLTGDLIPEEITVTSSQAVNANLLNPNLYWSYLSTSSLTSFNNSTSLFEANTTFVTSK
ncbi:MAG: hypothetical protein ACD_20C00302G0009 [uncultured bacterium]|nr:MAG: hypothetical protein ACD_20C00302G0009 [uncultured bacterium]